MTKLNGFAFEGSDEEMEPQSALADSREVVGSKRASSSPVGTTGEENSRNLSDGEEWITTFQPEKAFPRVKRVPRL